MNFWKTCITGNIDPHLEHKSWSPGHQSLITERSRPGPETSQYDHLAHHKLVRLPVLGHLALGGVADLGAEVAHDYMRHTPIHQTLITRN